MGEKHQECVPQALQWNPNLRVPHTHAQVRERDLGSEDFTKVAEY